LHVFVVVYNIQWLMISVWQESNIGGMIMIR
jgi:hypothetical protein